MRVFAGTLKHYDYSEDKTLLTWAWEDRIVTRVIDIKPGNFDDKLEIAIRVVDLDTWPATTGLELSDFWKSRPSRRSDKIARSIRYQNVLGRSTFY